MPEVESPSIELPENAHEENKLPSRQATSQENPRLEQELEIFPQPTSHEEVILNQAADDMSMYFRLSLDTLNRTKPEDTIRVSQKVKDESQRMTEILAEAWTRLSTAKLPLDTDWQNQAKLDKHGIDARVYHGQINIGETTYQTRLYFNFKDRQGSDLNEDPNLKPDREARMSLSLQQAGNPTNHAELRLDYNVTPDSRRITFDLDIKSINHRTTNENIVDAIPAFHRAGAKAGHHFPSVTVASKEEFSSILRRFNTYVAESVTHQRYSKAA
jgi:hypothetical protein